MLKVLVTEKSVQLYESKGRRQVVLHATVTFNQPIFYPKGPEVTIGDIAHSWRIDPETPVEEIKRLFPQAERRTLYYGCSEVASGVIEFAEVPTGLEPEIRERIKKGEPAKDVITGAVQWKIHPDFLWDMLAGWPERIRVVYFPTWLMNLLPPDLSSLLRRYRVRDRERIAVEATFWLCEEKEENVMVLGNEAVKIKEVELTEQLFAVEFSEVPMEGKLLEKILIELLPKMTEVVLAYRDIKREEESE